MHEHWPLSAGTRKRSHWHGQSAGTARTGSCSTVSARSSSGDRRPSRPVSLVQPRRPPVRRRPYSSLAGSYTTLLDRADRRHEALGAKLGAIIGRHQAIPGRLERSILEIQQALSHSQLCRATLGTSFASRGVRGSNPLSSTQVKGRFLVKEPALFDLPA